MSNLFVSYLKTFWATMGAGWQERAAYLEALYLSLGAGLYTKQRYLDIGSGNDKTTSYIGKSFTESFGLDLKSPKDSPTSRGNLIRIVGNAESLPFRDSSFDVVSMISLIEHVVKKEDAIREALRVLRPGGELLIEVPNRYFPLDFHYGGPNLLFLPHTVKSRVLAGIGYTDIPSPKRLEELVTKAEPQIIIQQKQIIWPSKVLPSWLRPLYSLMKNLGVFRVFPFGHFLLCQKTRQRVITEGQEE